MSVRHPRTGKEVKILQTDASIWKEHKTISFTQSCKCYDTVYTEGSPTFLLLLSPSTPAEIREACKRSVLVFLSRSAVKDMDKIRSLHLKNAVFLEELTAMYPHMGTPWDGTLDDAVTLVAILLGYRRILGCWNERAEQYGLSKAPQPFRLWWVTQYYHPADPRRRKEIDECLRRNSESKRIEKIVLLNESSMKLDDSIEERVIGHRITYADVIKAAATFPPDVVIAFANADICIDDKSWRSLWDVSLENKFLALLRYDVPASGKTEEAVLEAVPRSDSQDTWVIRVKDILDRGAETIAKTIDIPFGEPGCDNAVALEMLKHRFTVVNPALTMKTWHFHATNIRNYAKEDIIDRTMFHYVHPTGFHDIQPLINIPSQLIVNSFQPADILRTLAGGGATRWLSAFNKKAGTDDTPLKLSHTNPFTPSAEHVLRLANCFQTPGGLAFDKDKMYIGKSKVSQALWAQSTISAMTPTIESAKAIVVPWPDGADKSRELFVLRYLSKVLRIMPEGEIWEFFCPEKKEVVEAMEAFRWDTGRLPVIKYEKDLVVWCREALVALPTTVAVHAEDFAVLRNKLRGWKDSIDTADRLRIVIVEDGLVLDETLVRKLEDVLEKAFEVRIVYPSRTSIYRMTQVLAGAWGVICDGSIASCGWNWILPHGSFVFEVPGGHVGDTCLGISSAAGLQHRFCDKGEKQEEKIFEEIWREENN